MGDVASEGFSQYGQSFWLATMPQCLKSHDLVRTSNHRTVLHRHNVAIILTKFRSPMTYVDLQTYRTSCIRCFGTLVRSNTSNTFGTMKISSRQR